MAAGATRLGAAMARVQTPPRNSWAPPQGASQGSEGHSKPLLQTIIRPRHDRILPPRTDGRGSEAGVERVLVVWLWEKAVASSPVECRAWAPQIRRLW